MTKTLGHMKLHVRRKHSDKEDEYIETALRVYKENEQKNPKKDEEEVLDANVDDDEPLVTVQKDLREKRKSQETESDQSPAESESEIESSESEPEIIRRTRSNSEPSVKVTDSPKFQRMISVGSPGRSPARSGDENVRMPNGVNLKEFSVTMKKMSKKDISEQRRKKPDKERGKKELIDSDYSGATELDSDSEADQDQSDSVTEAQPPEGQNGSGPLEVLWPIMQHSIWDQIQNLIAQRIMQRN